MKKTIKISIVALGLIIGLAGTSIKSFAVLDSKKYKSTSCTTTHGDGTTTTGTECYTADPDGKCTSQTNCTNS